jgi:hypothetical protein
LRHARNARWRSVIRCHVTWAGSPACRPSPPSLSADPIAVARATAVNVGPPERSMAVMARSWFRAPARRGRWSGCRSRFSAPGPAAPPRYGSHLLERSRGSSQITAPRALPAVACTGGGLWPGRSCAYGGVGRPARSTSEGLLAGVRSRRPMAQRLRLFVASARDRVRIVRPGFTPNAPRPAATTQKEAAGMPTGQAHECSARITTPAASHARWRAGRRQPYDVKPSIRWDLV